MGEYDGKRRSINAGKSEDSATAKYQQV